MILHNENTEHNLFTVLLTLQNKFYIKILQHHNRRKIIQSEHKWPEQSQKIIWQKQLHTEVELSPTEGNFKMCYVVRATYDITVLQA
jgi:hypothetical protein